MQRGDVFNIQIGFLLGFPEINDLDVSLALVTDIDPVLFIPLDRKVGQGLLFFIAAEGTLDSEKMPLATALIAEQEAPFFSPNLPDFRFFAAYRAIAFGPFGAGNHIGIFLRNEFEGRPETLFKKQLDEIKKILFCVNRGFVILDVKGVENEFFEIIRAIPDFFSHFNGFSGGSFFRNAQKSEKVFSGLAQVEVTAGKVDQRQPAGHLFGDQAFIDGCEYVGHVFAAFLSENQDV
jgi:hypothetical protein